MKSIVITLVAGCWFFQNPANAASHTDTQSLEWQPRVWLDYGSFDHSSPSDGSNQFAIGLGADWHDRLAVDLGYLQNSRRFQSMVIGIDGQGNFQARTFDVYEESKVLMATVGWNWFGPESRWNLNTFAGAHRTWAKFKSDSLQEPSARASDLTFGARLDYRVLEDFDVGISRQRFQLLGGFEDRTALRLTYRF